MKYRLLLTVLLLFSVCPSFAQGSREDLVMTGTILSIDGVVSSLNNKRTTKYWIRLSLQIKNQSDEPYLVLRTSHFYGTRKIEFLSPSGSVGEVSTIETKPYCGDRDSIGQCNYSFDYHLDSLRGLEYSKFPKTAEFATIEPEGYFEFIDMLIVDNGFEFDEAEAIKDIEQQEQRFWEPILRNASKEKKDTRVLYERKLAEKEFRTKHFEAQRKVENTKFPYLTLEYRFSAKRLTTAPDLFLTLQDRWRKFGKLPLNGDDYFLKSEQIINDPSLFR